MSEFLVKFFIGAVTIPLLLFVIYGLFVGLPMSLYTKAECLRMGYPKSYVTIGLERYCSTLDGAVTVKVVKPSEK